jgi:two-component sensor histidine kinase/ABC-type amino acid transport substrate-binding protein
MMLRQLLLACILCSAALTPVAGQFGGGRQVLVGYYDARPSCWRNAESKPEGIFIDAARAVAARRGWELSFVYDSWDGLLDRLKTNRVDFVPSIVRTPEREAFAVFTEESVMTDWGVVYARPGSPIQSILDLEGKRVGALENDFWFSGPGSLRGLAESFGLKPSYRYFPDYSTLFAALGRGDVDAVAASNSLGLVWVPLLPIATTPIVYNPIELRFAAPRESPEGAALAREMDGALRELRVSEPDRLPRILSAYAIPVRKVYQTPGWVALTLGALALVLVAIIAALARQTRMLGRSVEETRRALTRLDEARGALEKSLGEKELLVHELSHRVKNNLQLVLSLMSLLADESDESGERLLGRLREKVYAIAMAEDELFSSGGLSQASLESMVASTISRVAAAEGRQEDDFSARIDLRGATIVASAIIPLNIIASELLANACRHGASADGSLSVAVRVESMADGGAEIEVSDRGAGLPDRLQALEARGLGLRLVQALAFQLEGSVETARGPGGGARVLVRVNAHAWSAARKS